MRERMGRERMEAVPVEGAVDHRGRAAARSATGRWTSASFIIAVEITERFAYIGIGSNLISYLTGPLGQPTATAAAAINTWSGAALLLPLAGAFIADSCLGRYTTIAAAALLYVLGLGLLTLSAVLPTILPSECKLSGSANSTSCPPSQFQLILFYTSLYIVALAQSGHRPCVQAFGADQFDQTDAEERKSRASFFNWWCFGIASGILVANVVLSYIQDNIGWGFGFGIPCIAMGIGLVVFLLGTHTYRYYPLQEESPFVRVGRAFIALAKSNRGPLPDSNDEEDEVFLPNDPTKAVAGSCRAYGKATNIDQMEEAKGVLQLIPIWTCCFIYGAVSAQIPTFFTKQGSTLNRRIGDSLVVPPAALQSFINLSVVAFIPFYDRILVPAARKFSKLPPGITMLQRIGIGIVIQSVLVAVAALVEMKRLDIASDLGLADQPKATIPMSLWWLVPQYVLSGISDVFTLVGLQEFFYDQVPDTLRSLGLALYLSVFGFGNIISSFLIFVIDEVTGKEGGESWFSDNLNRAHLDYFYWLLAVLNSIGLLFYLHFAKSYVYKKEPKIVM